MKTATFDQYLELGQMIKRGEVSKEALQAIIGHQFTGEISHGVASMLKTITVPDLSSTELLRRVASWPGKTPQDPDLTRLDLYQNANGRPLEGQGEEYEVLVLAFAVKMETRDIISQFQLRGFDGNYMAFLAWTLEYQPLGYYATLLQKPGLMFYQGKQEYGSTLLYSQFSDVPARMTLCSMSSVWQPPCNFVGFRKIK